MDQSTVTIKQSYPFTIILPAFNEEVVVGKVVADLKMTFPQAEILVVDDGSVDQTAEVARQSGAVVVRHPYNLGNGAAIKSGARHAKGKYFVFMDADGQHAADDIPKLLEKLAAGYELVVGARSTHSQATITRRIGNGLLNRFASLLTGQKIPDLTSGFRAARASTFRRFLHLLPNGFSYPTTTTLVFMRSGFPVGFIPIAARRRKGDKSKIRLVRDGIWFFVIIMKVITLYSPMRVFFPVSVMLFLLGLGRYLYVFFENHRLSNMPVILFVAAVITFLIGLVSEQITALHLLATLPRGEQNEEE